jgi:hypothetical protein
MNEEPILSLTRELWKHSSPGCRCPHVAFNGKKCRCNAVEDSAAELICDTESLQLWFLDGEQYPECHFYPKKTEQEG